jgi:uncharacterized protein (PEP-CTERM system associated)
LHLRLGWRPTAAAAVGLLAAFAPGAHAAEVRIESGASATVTVTDNVRTEPNDRKEGGVILGQTGETSIRGDGNRLDFALDLTLDLIETLGGDDDVAFQQTGFGFARAELLEDLFFVELDGSARRVLTSPTQGVSANPYSTGQGRAQAYSASISPWLQNDFAGWAEGELRYRRSEIILSEGLGDSSVDEFTAKLATGKRFDRLRLDGLAERHVTDSQTDTGDLERSTFLAEGRWFLIRELALTAMGGHETIEAPSLLDPPSGPIWSLGFLTRPGPRTELEASFGQRYGGSTLEGAASYRITPRLVFRASYGEAIETTQERLLGTRAFDRTTNQFVDPRTGQVAEADPGTGNQNRAYRSKLATASLTGTYERTTTTVRFEDESRDFDVTADDHVRRLSAEVTRRLRTDLEGAVLVGLQRYDGPGTQDYRTALGRVELAQDLARNLKLTGALMHSRRVGDQPGLGYGETAALVGLRYGF